MRRTVCHLKATIIATEKTEWPKTRSRKAISNHSAPVDIGRILVRAFNRQIELKLNPTSPVRIRKFPRSNSPTGRSQQARLINPKMHNPVRNHAQTSSSVLQDVISKSRIRTCTSTHYGVTEGTKTSLKFLAQT